jgi:hypothetical protein
MEIKNCDGDWSGGQPLDQKVVVERLLRSGLFLSPSGCCVEQLQSVCSQPSPAAQPLLQ